MRTGGRFEAVRTSYHVGVGGFQDRFEFLGGTSFWQEFDDSSLKGKMFFESLCGLQLD